jgi:hypothetical protein
LPNNRLAILAAGRRVLKELVIEEDYRAFEVGHALFQLRKGKYVKT